MASRWQVDDALLYLIRDREVMGHVLADVSGEEVASGNAGATAKVQRQLCATALLGRIIGRNPVYKQSVKRRLLNASKD